MLITVLFNLSESEVIILSFLYFISVSPHHYHLGLFVYLIGIKMFYGQGLSVLKLWNVLLQRDRW